VAAPDRSPPTPRRDGRSSPYLARAARYSRWDGRGDLGDLDAADVLDALTDDLLAEGDLEAALRELLERGWRPADPTRRPLPGLRDLLERLAEARRDVLDRHRLDDVLADVRAELAAIVEAEEAAIAERLDRLAATPPADADLAERLRAALEARRERLAGLPDRVGARIADLESYDFLDAEARSRFEALLERLRSRVAETQLGGLAEALRNATPEQLAATREMVRQLNDLLAERLAGGGPDEAKVRDFLRRFGAAFPGATSLDDVIDQLADRMAAFQTLLNSLSPEARSELAELVDALLRDDRLRWDLARLAATLDRLIPGGLGGRLRFGGREPMGLEQALEAIDRVAEIDALRDALAGVEGPADLRAVDRDAVRRLLGPEADAALETLESLAARLEAEGYAVRVGDRLQLTPRGTRRIGQRVLDEVFARLGRDAFGGHRIDRAGRGGEAGEGSKPYEFGDPLAIDLRATLDEALRRPENAPDARPAGARPTLRLAASDFQVRRTEQLTRSATVLLVDMSRSMLLRGCFLAAKKVAVALDTLIRTQFPRDRLAVVGFAYYAREIRPETLAELSWHGFEYGTNLEHGLALARRILARERGANRSIIVVTDGEPTAHLEGGHVEFSYPPTRRTIEATLREVVRCTREGITINTFMLERSRALAEFVAEMTRLNRGRAFYASPETLGEYVLVDFVSRRTRKVS
jgi:uncharacterized protein with von Willebrand factor type A (vWA) domain